MEMQMQWNKLMRVQLHEGEVQLNRSMDGERLSALWLGSFTLRPESIWSELWYEATIDATCLFGSLFG